MFSLVIVRIQRYIQQCSSIAYIRQFLSRAIELLIRLTQRFRNSRAQEDEEKSSVITYEALSLRSAGEYICASQLPKSSSPETTEPSEPCSSSDTPYDTPTRLVIHQTPQPARKQTSHELMANPENLIVPALTEVRDSISIHTPSPRAATRPIGRLFEVNSIGPELSQVSPTRTSGPLDDYAPQPILARATIPGGSLDDPLFGTPSFWRSRRHELVKPNSPDQDSEPISRSGSTSSNMSLGRSSYRTHDRQVPRPRPPTPSIYEGTRGISTATLAAALASEVDGSQVPFAPRPTISDHAYSNTTGPRFVPMSANGVKRFDRHARGFAMIDPSISDYKINAYQVQYPNHDGELPKGWTAHVHPEGARYFMNAQARTYTESHVCSQEVLLDIVFFSNYLHHELRVAIDTKKIDDDIDYDEVELVLEPKKTLDEEGEIICCYYFVNPVERCLFWLDEYDAEDMLGECRGVTSLSHKSQTSSASSILVCITTNIPEVNKHLPRKHWEMFPNLCLITRDLLDELKELMLHATCDHLTTTRSAAALSADELKQYFEIVKFIRVESGVDRAHSVVIIGRIMHTFCRNQYLNFHGQPCARLSVDQTVRGWSYKPSIYMTIFAPLLYMAPVAHVRSLHTSTAEWKIFITRLNGQLQNLNLLGTVLLGVNVGFLAIQSVDKGAGRSLTQIASYMSLVLSFGSIALGLTFIDLDLTGKERGSEATRFLRRMNDGKHGLEKLAIIYSLPYALLMWSMLLSLLAFSYEWCGPGDAVSRSIVGVVLLVVFGLILWCISVASDKHAPWWKSDQPQDHDVGKTSKETHARKHSWRNGLATHFRSWFATKNRVSMLSIRSARNGSPPPAPRATQTSVSLTNFRRATVSRQTPPKITTTRPESAEVN